MSLICFTWHFKTSVKIKIFKVIPINSLHNTLWEYNTMRFVVMISLGTFSFLWKAHPNNKAVRVEMLGVQLAVVGTWMQDPLSAGLPLAVLGLELLSVTGYHREEKNNCGPTGRLPSHQTSLVPLQLTLYLMLVRCSLQKTPGTFSWFLPYCSFWVCFLDLAISCWELLASDWVSIALPSPVRFDVLFQRSSSNSKLLSNSKTIGQIKLRVNFTLLNSD